MANLLVTLLGKVGAPIERLGDSTGPLTLEPIFEVVGWAERLAQNNHPSRFVYG